MNPLSKSTKLPDLSDARDRRSIELDHQDIHNLLVEGLNQHLYLGGEPGTNNRREIKYFMVGQRLHAVVNVWTVKDKS